MNKLNLFVLLLTSSLLSSQNYVGETFKLSADSDNVVFLFEDDNSDGSYISGTFVKGYLKITLDSNEFKTFQSNLKKVSKKSEHTIEAKLYDLDKYSWDESRSVYIRVGNKIGTIRKKEVKDLLRL